MWSWQISFFHWSIPGALNTMSPRLSTQQMSTGWTEFVLVCFGLLQQSSRGEYFERKDIYLALGAKGPRTWPHQHSMGTTDHIVTRWRQKENWLHRKGPMMWPLQWQTLKKNSLLKTIPPLKDSTTSDSYQGLIPKTWTCGWSYHAQTIAHLNIHTTVGTSGSLFIVLTMSWALHILNLIVTFNNVSKHSFNKWGSQKLTHFPHFTNNRARIWM